MESKFELVKNETGDVNAYTIRETGAVNEFSFTDLLNIMESNDKKEREVIAQRDADLARAQNIEQHHPEILTLEPVKLFAAGMYAELKASLEGVDEKLAQFAKAKEDNEKRKAQILAQLPELAEANKPKEN